MREIKFRAWTIGGVYPDTMLHQQDVDDEGEVWFTGIPPDMTGRVHYLFGDVLDVKECVLMQYTGLKDKNGKEIYEGDIVQVNHPHKNRKYRGQVIWNEYRWTGKDFFFPHLDVPQDLFCEGTEYIEVIGNIYENPELLSTP